MTKHQRSKRPPVHRPAPTSGDHLQEVQKIQEQLERITDLQRQAVAARRQAVAKAWENGATAKELAQVLKISLAKVYTLLPKRTTA